jgi:L,D-transpeptidase ErfK/SrfK
MVKAPVHCNHNDQNLHTQEGTSMAMKQTRALGAQTRRQKAFSACLFVLVLCSLLADRRASSQAQQRFSEQVVGSEFPYNVQKGDSLTSIGARFGAGVGFLAANNNLSTTSLLKIGQLLRIDNRHIIPNSVKDGIVINIPQRLLFYFKEGRLIRHFPVGLGRQDWPTPTGEFRIVVKEEDPTWDVPPSIQEEMRREGKVVKTCVPPGPDNPLGKHWLGLSIGGYGIHGTIAPASIYHFQTHGCIRAHPDDIAELFGDVARGTPGILIYRRLLMARVGRQVYLEVHRDVYKKEPDVLGQFEELVRTLNLEPIIDRQLAEDIIRKQDGIARQITREIGDRNSR